MRLISGSQWTFPKISWLKIKISKNWDSLVDERVLITATLTSYCHWKILAPFYLREKRPENAFLTLIVNYCKIVQKKKIMPSSTTINWLFNDVCDSFTGCFDWKIAVSQQTVVRVFYILHFKIYPWRWRHGWNLMNNFSDAATSRSRINNCFLKFFLGIKN